MGIRRNIKKFNNFIHRILKWNSMMLSSGWCVWRSDALDLDLLVNRKSYIDHAIWKSGVYDPHTIRALEKIIHSKDVTYFFDIGANIGQMSCFVKRVCPHVCVFAFEPVWQNFVHLEMNKIINLLDITSECLALGDEVGDMTLFMPNIETKKLHGQKINMGMPSIILDDFMDKDNKIKVRSDIFDYYVENLEISSTDVCVVKIDVEGAEKKVIRGMRNFLDSHKEIIIIIELNISRNNDVKEIVSFFCENGFVIYDMLLSRIDFADSTIKDGNYVFARPNCFSETLNPLPKKVVSSSSIIDHSSLFNKY